MEIKPGDFVADKHGQILRVVFCDENRLHLLGLLDRYEIYLDRSHMDSITKILTEDQKDAAHVELTKYNQTMNNLYAAKSGAKTLLIQELKKIAGI